MRGSHDDLLAAACTAWVRGPGGRGWWRFESAREVLLAESPEEVPWRLQQVEDAARKGLWGVGFVAYEAAPSLDPSLATHPAGAPGPLAAFGLFEAPRWVDELPRPSHPARVGQLALRWRREQYVRAVEEIRRGIQAGEVYQVNLAFPLVGRLEGDSEDLFLGLAEGSGVAHAAHLAFGERRVLCLSPELFFERDGRRVRMQPMKGTRPRGRTLAEDRRLCEELLSSPKERAENLMILDMVRNDLGRIARPGSVQVEKPFLTEPYPTVWQMTSGVAAESEAGLLELFRAVFPSASVTGAPKKAAMEAIARIEEGPRGVYCGAVGWVGPGGRACFAVGIRTAEIDAGTGHFRYPVGSGITWDCDPAREWEECGWKARVLEPWPEFELLETMRQEPDGSIPYSVEHMDRLQRSAELWGFPFDLHQVSRLLWKVLPRWDGAKALDSLQAETCGPLQLRSAIEGSDLLSKGASPFGQGGKQKPRKVRLTLSRSGWLSVMLTEIEPEPSPWRIRVAGDPVDPDDRRLYHKTTLRDRYDQALAEARRHGAQEAILRNRDGWLTEGTRTNLLVRLEGRWWTPPVEAGLLPGVYRERLWCMRRVQERPLRPEDLERAEELALVNAVRGWIPAVLDR